MPNRHRPSASAAPPCRPAALRSLVVLGLLLLPGALAQRPLLPPNYYLSSLPVLRAGAPLDGELTRDDGQDFKDGSRVDLYRFEGRAGSRITLVASSEVVDTTLSVFDARGTLLGSADDDPDTGSTDAALTLTLPEDGRYLAVVGGYAAEDLGAYRVTLREAEASAPASAELPVPGTVDGTLDPAAPPAPDLFGGPSRSYAVTLDRSLLLLATLRSEAFDAGLLLYDDGGALVAFGDDNVDLGGTDARVAAELPAGRYTLVVSAYDPGSGGPFRLELQRFAPLD